MFININILAKKYIKCKNVYVCKKKIIIFDLNLIIGILISNFGGGSYDISRFIT